MLIAAGVSIAPPWVLADGARVFRAAVIGHTGKGDYGHGHDLIFSGREDIRLVAVADADAGGLKNALDRTGAPKGYEDYREMLDREKPDLVSIAPRWTDQHHAMAMTALRSGAHVWMEKPITQTLAEADELLALAQQSGLKVAVAHQMRLAPDILQLKEDLEKGRLGELCSMHAHGKQDHRAGGEDLLVLGVHLFDLMRFYGGDPRWCAAHVMQHGRDITREDRRQATENIGPVAGDEILAQFAFNSGVEGTFTSQAKAKYTLGHWGLRVVGSKGVASVLADISPRVFLLQATPWSQQGRAETWHPIRGSSSPSASTAVANRRLVDDWLAAIHEDREPLASGYSGLKALEMAMAVFEAGLTRCRVPLPLVNRSHPLA